MKKTDWAEYGRRGAAATKRNGTHCKGEYHPHCKLTDDDVRTIRERYKNKDRVVEIAEDFNVTVTYCYKLIRREARGNVK